MQQLTDAVAEINRRRLHRDQRLLVFELLERPGS
jgi:hypothetical protein